MTIVSVVNPAQREVIGRILTRGGLASRAPPPETRPPPAPLTRELANVTDSEFVDDPPPAELVWSAD